MTTLLMLIDVAPDPVSLVPWGALILLLVIVFILAVGFTAGLVVFLIWWKRRKANHAETVNEVSSTE